MNRYDEGKRTEEKGLAYNLVEVWNALPLHF